LSNPRGFTLIEVVVAMAILLVVMIGVLSSISFAYNSSNDTELRNTAKNVATYTLEYLRSRTVTRGTSADRLTALGITGSSTGTYGWYDASTNANGAFPSMVDVGDLPLQSDGYPCNYTSTYVRTASIVDGNNNSAGIGGIGAGGAVIKFASKQAAKVADPPNPADTYADRPLAFTSTLQGYVSVRDMTAPGSTVNPALPEDGNLARMQFSGSNVASGTYRTTLTDLASVGAWTDLIVRYPGVYPSTPPVITSFTPGATYLAKVYTTDANKVLKSNQEYNPYYTNVGSQKAATQDYRGFRVLTQVVARATGPIVAGFRHVQYYDVTVTVLWMSGTRESNYELVSRIVAY
jgi:prepilin-type N-terminal cleavage/methylation domain-containing protein